MTSDSDLPTRIEVEILRQTGALGPEKTICPSDAARALTGSHPDNWGPLMTPIRKIAVRLAMEGRVIITRKGKQVDPSDFRGVYRIGAPRSE